MPFEVRKVGNQWCVFTEGTDEKHGCHATEEEAQAQQRALYANVPEARKKSTSMDLLISLGGAVKAHADGRVEGRLVPFAGPDALDLDGEFFDAKTDFGLDFPARIGTYFDHGMDETIGRKRLGKADVEVRDDGVWMTSQLDLSDRYQKRIHELAQKGRLYLSSGAAPHLVERESVGKGVRLAAWPLAESTYTVRPANPNAGVWAVKNAAAWMEERVPFAEACKSDFGACGCQQKSSAGLGTGPTLAEHSAAVVSAVQGYVERVEDRAAFRLAVETKAGRMLSGANIAELEAVLAGRAGLNELFERIEALLEKARPKATEDDENTADTPVPEQAAEPPQWRTEHLRRQTRQLAESLAGSARP